MSGADKSGNLAIAAFIAHTVSTTCPDGWITTNGALSQVANCIVLASYLAPPGIRGQLFLRILLTIGCLLRILYSWLQVCSFDGIIWNSIFLLINLGYVLYILWRLRPWIVFPPDVELVYRELFLPLKVSKESFQRIYKCVRNIESINPYDVYCTEGVTKADKLSVVLSGRVAVIRKGKVVHVIDKHQFIDSPEWFGVGVRDTYQVTIKAIEKSTIMTWHRDKLKLCIAENYYLTAVLDNILGKDVVKKLLFVFDYPAVDFESLVASSVTDGAPIDESSTLIVHPHSILTDMSKNDLKSNGSTNYIARMSSGIPSFWSLLSSRENLTETNNYHDETKV